MKKFFAIICAMLFIIPLLTSCGEKLEYVCDVEWRTFENRQSEERTDLISFYATAEDTVDGNWDYSFTEEGLLEEYLSNSETKTTKKLSVTYETFAFKPLKEGETIIAFDLKTADGNIARTKYIAIKVKKDDFGKFRITAEETKA